MDHFSNFPKLNYFGRDLTDTNIRLDFLSKIKSNIALFEYTDVIDGERPEDIAFLVYGDAGLYWIILYLNERLSVDDWVMTSNQLENYIEQKYGINKIYAIHHYETTSSSELGKGVWVNSGTPFSVAITNFDYENQLNEQKRKIKLIKPRYIQQVLAEYYKAVK